MFKKNVLLPTFRDLNRNAKWKRGNVNIKLKNETDSTFKRLCVFEQATNLFPKLFQVKTVLSQSDTFFVLKEFPTNSKRSWNVFTPSFEEIKEIE